MNYYTPNWLRGIGISEHTPDLRDITYFCETQNKAYCHSVRCAGSKAHKGVERNVRKDVDLCPKCGYYLVWKRIPICRGDQQ